MMGLLILRYLTLSLRRSLPLSATKTSLKIGKSSFSTSQHSAFRFTDIPITKILKARVSDNANHPLGTNKPILSPDSHLTKPPVAEALQIDNNNGVNASIPAIVSSLRIKIARSLYKHLESQLLLGKHCELPTMYLHMAMKDNVQEMKHQLSLDAQQHSGLLKQPDSLKEMEVTLQEVIHMCEIGNSEIFIPDSRLEFVQRVAENYRKLMAEKINDLLDDGVLKDDI